ncbi:ABC transporter permease [Luteipulveratus mongoliensis]|uniref:ABC transmembrane type-1 domain-containing protein n=1 Tax=Luteipulveratus mongoliensis TaxID=571913 RepID=A0A0K1JK88_9MICO|nr:ABC transporter permease [Luteipulveratus mongoliensis]AKU17116.1 hypothetical protein VV02_16700 [Luteipulveratus mongoliensis]
MSKRLRVRIPTNTGVRIGLLIFAFFVLVAVVGPTVVTGLMGRSPTAIDLGALSQPPSGHYWLGTTAQGEDVFAQLVVGTRTSLLIGVVGGTIASVLSVVIGVASAYLGGVVDAAVTAGVNVMIVLPGLPLLIVIASYTQGRGGWVMIAVVIGLTGWAGGARVKRAQTLSLRNRDFVTAAELSGDRPGRIVVHELMPHLAPVIATTFVFSVVGAIFAEAGLAFIGATDINTVSWGSMLANSQKYGALLTGSWWWFAPPGICIALLGTAAGIINFGVDEITNPRQRAVVRARRWARRAAKEAAAQESARTPGTAEIGGAR